MLRPLLCRLFMTVLKVLSSIEFRKGNGECKRGEMMTSSENAKRLGKRGSFLVCRKGLYNNFPSLPDLKMLVA